MTKPAAILDIDGTLVDTNYQHAIAWYMAFRQHDVRLPVWRIHRHIGMGGDQLVKALAGDEVEAELGDDIRSAEKALYLSMIQSTQPLDGARELIADLKAQGREVVLASSAKDQEVDHYLELLDARELVDAWTTSDDVEATKPEPDLVQAALDKLDARRGGDGRRHAMGRRGGQARRHPDDRRDDRRVLRAGAARRRRGCGVRLDRRVARRGWHRHHWGRPSACTWRYPARHRGRAEPATPPAGARCSRPCPTRRCSPIDPSPPEEEPGQPAEPSPVPTEPDPEPAPDAE